MNLGSILNRRKIAVGPARHSGGRSRNQAVTDDPSLSTNRIVLLVYLRMLDDQEKRNRHAIAGHLEELLQRNRGNHHPRAPISSQILHHGSEEGGTDRPLSNPLLRQLPRARIFAKDRSAFGHDGADCSICCCRLVDGVVLMRLCCGHVFHAQCLAPWLSRQSTCPDCRYEMPIEGVADSEEAELNRRERMKGRVTYQCRCPPSGMHSCFFVDPSRSLSEQCKISACFTA